MAKEEKQLIVIKKVYEEGGGHHGGAWKVAFADFMTAMMCFFLVMWLLNQSEEVKKQVANYFTGPSIIEHQFTSYGAELTLEKLFLDLVNQPLKVVQDFMQPADFTPNLMASGSKKIVLQEIAQNLGEIATNVDIGSSQVTFEIPDQYLFDKNSNKPSADFSKTMEKINAITGGLRDSIVEMESIYFYDRSDMGDTEAKWVAKSRLDIVMSKVKAGFEHSSNEIQGSSRSVKNTASQMGTKKGLITFAIRQKEVLPDGRKPRPLKDVFDSNTKGKNPYETFVKRASQAKKQK